MLEVYRFLKVIPLLAVLVSSDIPTVQAEIYRWIDEKGRVHFGDSKPANGHSDKLKLKIAPSQWKPYDIQVEQVEPVFSPEEIERIRHDVNLVYRFFDQALFFDFYKTVPVNIRIEKNEAAYDQYLHRILVRVPPRSRGIFIGKTNQIVTYPRDDREQTFATLKHETSHAILHTVIPDSPIWLNEGLAEQLEMLELSEGHLQLRRHPENSALLQHPDERIPIRRFLDLQNGQWRSHRSRHNNSLHAQSGEFVFFLLSHRNGRQFLNQILREYQHGNRKRSLYLVEDHYIGNVTGIEINWNNWLKQTHTPALKF